MIWNRGVQNYANIFAGPVIIIASQFMAHFLCRFHSTPPNEPITALLDAKYKRLTQISLYWHLSLPDLTWHVFIFNENPRHLVSTTHPTPKAIYFTFVYSIVPTTLCQILSSHSAFLKLNQLFWYPRWPRGIKRGICCHSLAGITGSNPTRSIDACLLKVLYLCSGRGLCAGLITRPE